MDTVKSVDWQEWGRWGIAILLMIGVPYLGWWYKHLKEQLDNERDRAAICNYLKQGGWLKRYRMAIGYLNERLDFFYGRKLWGWMAFVRSLMIAMVYPFVLFLLAWQSGASGEVAGIGIMPASIGWLDRIWRAGLIILATFISFLFFSRLPNILSNIFTKTIAFSSKKFVSKILNKRKSVKKLSSAFAGVYTFFFAIAIAIPAAAAIVNIVAIAGAGAGAVAIAFAGAVAGAVDGAVVIAGTGGFAVAVTGAITGAVVGVGAVIGGAAGAGTGAVVFAGVGALAFAGAFALVIADIIARSYVVAFAVAFAGAGAFAGSVAFSDVNITVLLLFYAVLPVLNSLFDWISWAATRYFLRRAQKAPLGARGMATLLIELSADLIAAFFALAALAIILPNAIEAFNHLLPSIVTPVDWKSMARTALEAPFSRGLMVTGMLATTIFPTVLHLAVGISGASMAIYPRTSEHAKLIRDDMSPRDTHKVIMTYMKARFLWFIPALALAILLNWGSIWLIGNFTGPFGEFLFQLAEASTGWSR